MDRVAVVPAFTFGPFRLDAVHRVLWRGEELVGLPPKAVDLLTVLIERRGEVVSKEELLRAVWPDVFVEEANLAVHVSELRRVFTSVDRGREYIQTVPRRGYRFAAAPVTPAAPPVAMRPATRALAVLPFQVLEPDARSEPLGLGIADSLIARLSYLREVSVRPTSAVLAYAGGGRDPRELGRELGVDLVLEGRVRRADQAIRLSVQLLDVRDHGAPVWAETFDEAFTGIFVVEDRISAAVAAALALELDAGERAQRGRHHTESVEAYEDYITGRFFWNKLTGESIARAMVLFQSATRRDPDYALPYAGLADAYLVLGFSGFLPPRDAWQLAGAAATRALELDDTLAEAHVSLAYVQLFADWNWTAAHRELRRAIALKPQSSAAHHWYALFLDMLGRFDEAMGEVKLAQQLDPVSLIARHIVGYQHYLAGRHAEEAEEYRRIVELEASFFVAHWGLGLAYEHLGRLDEMLAEHRRAVELSEGSPMMKTVLARSLIIAGRTEEAAALRAELDALPPGIHLAPYPLATLAVTAGDLGGALEQLERACAARDPWMVWVGVDPMLDPLRGEARFQALLQRVGLAG